jgi:hypothetical protein
MRPDACSEWFLAALGGSALCGASGAWALAALTRRLDPALVVARSRGLLISVEIFLTLGATLALARSAWWPWPAVLALLHALVVFELWFSRKNPAKGGEEGEGRLRVLALVAGALGVHALLLLLLLGEALAGACRAQGAGAVVAGVASAAAGVLLLAPPPSPVRARPAQSAIQIANALPTPSAPFVPPPRPAAAPAAAPSAAPAAAPAREQGPRPAPPSITQPSDPASEGPRPIPPASPTARPASPPRSPTSALHENILRKGENSYYHAHKDTPTEEHIDKGAGPVSLHRGRVDSAPEENKPTTAALTAIRSYSFSDGKASVSIYIELAQMDKQGQDVAHEVEFTETSVRVVIGGTHVLVVPKLKNAISDAKCKLSSGKDRVTVTLKKADASTAWPSLQ